jgi:hypothetical protein
MAFPSGTNIDTTNFSATGDPSLARADLLQLIQVFNQLINSENLNTGVAVLNATGKLNSNQIPGTLAPTGDQTLAPEGGVVNIENVLRLKQLLTVELGNAAGTDSPVAGDMVYLTDGDAGTPCLAVHDGSNYRVVRFAMVVGDVGATLSSTATLSATADP